MTSSAPPAGGDPRAELDRLAHEILPGGRRALDRLLPLFAARAGGGAAVYLNTEEGLQRAAIAGAGEFAEALSAPPTGSLAFAGGHLAWLPPAPPENLSAEALALALAVAAAAREVQLAGQLRVQDFEVRARGVQIEALYEVGLAIASTLDFERLCEEILMRAVSLLDARRGALYLRDGGIMRLERAFGGDADAVVDPDSKEGRELLSGTPSPSCCALPGAQFLLGVPIGVERVARGVLVVGDKESRHGVGPFVDGDRRTLELLANQAAIALENAELHRTALEKERLEREVELAAEIQRQILPKGVPEVPGFELWGWSRPARHIGGDYYDFFGLDGAERRLTLVVGDASGKGMPAALLVSTLHSSLRLLAERLSIRPELFERLNRHILESSAANKFITLFAGELDPASGGLVYLNAGHNPALVVRASGEVERLGPGGLPLGLLPDAHYRADRLDLAGGDLLCLYSDGITEATSPADEEFGLERLAALLASQRDRALPEVMEAVDGAVTRFVEGAPQGDDQTMVLLRRTG